MLVGYPYARKGYKLYDLKEKQLFLSRDVVFKEDVFPFLNTSLEQDALKLQLNQLPGYKCDILQDSMQQNTQEDGNEEQTIHIEDLSAEEEVDLIRREAEHQNDTVEIVPEQHHR